MSLRVLKLLTIVLPPVIIGGFEFFRHRFLIAYLSMEAGNFYITLLTLLLSYMFAAWMFRSIESSNRRLTEVEARRAVYEDRERLARELHDDLAQTLFFLNVKLKQGQIEDAKMAVSEIDNSLRQAIFNLRTTPEESTSFSMRLHKWLGDWHKITGIELQEELTFEKDSFRSSEEVQLFGIIQEAFTNIRKHSAASRASILLMSTNQEWRLVIKDNGIGIAEAYQTHKHYGIDMMRKRAAEMGTQLHLGNRKDQMGTELAVSAHRRIHE